MRNRLFKLSIFILFCAVFAVCSLEGLSVRANSNRPSARNTGAPGEQNCTSCHDGAAVNSGGGALTLTGLPASYSPNQAIPLTVRMSQSGRAKFGFQVTAIDDTGKQAGAIVATDTTRTTLSTGTVNGASRQYIGQTNAGTAASAANQGSWTFTWNAPAAPVGRVTFYVSGLSANNDGDTPGDFVYTINQSIQPGAAVATLTNVSAASYAPNVPLTAGAISSGWAMGLGQNMVAATTLPLPTTLDGAQILVQDSANTTRNAGIFFISPGQVNYLVPTGTANGAATITIQRNGAPVARGTMTVDSVAPGIFSANANGQGVAAAVVLRSRNNVNTFEPVAQLNQQTQRFDATPIDLGPQTDQVYLVLFGTGFRNNTALSATSATIGGTASSVLFAGAHSVFAGLDQANILIPRSLIGRGLVNVVFSAAGKAANTVQINIK